MISNSTHPSLLIGQSLHRTHFADFFLYLMCLSEKLPDEPLLSEARGSKVAQGGVAQ
jgi:hypothetical protein